MHENPRLDLRTCLEAASWRRLLAIMASHGLPCSTRWKKADLVQTLHTHLMQPDVLRETVMRLSQPAQDALIALLRADGALPAHTFTARFGAIRPYRPWRKDAEPRQPWQNPASPAERLWYLGLLHLYPPRPAPGVTQWAILPADLVPLLQEWLLAPQSQTPLRLLPRPGYPPDLAWHVALLLATLEADTVRPLKGGWLPPRTLAALAARIGLDQEADYQPRRSERQIPYLAFLHYLALAAELMDAGHHLGLTARAWQWLAVPPKERWHTLWQAWQAAPAELARPFRFPWASLGPRARTLVLDQLRRVSLGTSVPLAQVVEQVRLSDEHRLLARPWDSEEDPIAAFITGPLFWFGVVDLGEKPPTAPDHSQSLPYTLQLTSLGTWLLELPDCGPPPFPSPQPCLIRAPEWDVVRVPPTAQPLHLARLAPLCRWLPPEFPAPEQRLQLSEERVAQTVAQGTAVAQVFDVLETALGQPPSRRLRQRLRAWAGAGQQVRVRHLTVLETRDAKLMGRLRSRKRIRRHLGEILSPTCAELNPAGLEALLQTLRTLGLYAAPPPALQPTEDHPTPDTTSHPTLSTADASLLYMAARVYQGLGDYVRLPARLPTALLEELTTSLTPAQREAAEHSARQVLEGVRAALQGYLAMPAWQLPSTSEDVLPTIETALAAGHDLTLTYWGAGREQAIVRRVTPYWLERRDKALYLIAYCHLREDQRVFRVDRILQAHPFHGVENPDSVVKEQIPNP